MGVELKSIKIRWVGVLKHRRKKTPKKCEISLKMLGLYLFTLIIGHKYCNTLSILNKLTSYKELQYFAINNVFLDKKVKTQQQQYKKSNIKTLAGAGD